MFLSKLRQVFCWMEIPGFNVVFWLIQQFTCGETLTFMTEHETCSKYMYNHVLNVTDLHVQCTFKQYFVCAWDIPLAVVPEVPVLVLAFHMPVSDFTTSGIFHGEKLCCLRSKRIFKMEKHTVI